MKKALLFLLVSLFSFKLTLAQSVITVSGDISSNTTWTSNNVYLLNGFVYVTNSATLTIEPGTLIKGDKASKGSLIITRGSKIIADGTAAQPIVFTSNEPAGLRGYGDWGGLILCGRAPLNDPAGEKVIEGGVDATKGLYGGTDPDDNSGILRYVRIEFPGIAFMPNNEINGLTLGGVGRGTTVDYVQISYSGDDSYECFGGTVNLKHLIAYRGLDDDFDTDFGFSGRCQFLVSLRDSNVADVSGSNGFESDNDATGTTNLPYTYPVYTNVTVVGPSATAGTMISSNFKRGAHIRRSAKTSIFNSAISGFPTGLLIDGVNCETNASANELNFRNNSIAGCSTPLAVTSTSTFDITTWFNQSGFNNSIFNSSSDLQLQDAFNYDQPSFLPAGTSPLLSTSDFSHPLLTDPFFENVNYRGAFGNVDWTAGWANWDAQNTGYTSIYVPEVIQSAIVYPNPVNEFTAIEINLLKPVHLSLTITDMAGRVVIEKGSERFAIGKNRISFDTSMLTAGLYTLRLVTTEGSSSTLISKQ